MLGQYIHAVDGFEEHCSLGCLVCSAEDPETSTFSAMLLDFRRPKPCVSAVPLTSALGTMLWPLRCGPAPRAYANIVGEDPALASTIVSIDFRNPCFERQDSLKLPHVVDDFRCFGGAIYAACTESLPSGAQRTQISRCTPTDGTGHSEILCTAAETREVGHMQEDLKVLSVNQQGLALSWDERLSHGGIVNKLRNC